MNRRPTVTIRDVAERAGVSQMTVSRVLNQRELVSAKTCSRVEEAIAELNYRPNIMARNLAGGRSMLLGLVYFNPSPGYLSELLNGALRACRDLSHHLVLEDLSEIEESSDTSQIARRLDQVTLDGLILTPPLCTNETLLRLMQARRIPIVLAGHVDPEQHFSSVVYDDAAAARTMTTYLISKGHTRIACITGPPGHPASELRRAGYLAALAEHGLAPREDWIAKGDFTFGSGLQLARQILSASQRPTAVFASNDDMAAGVVAAAHSLSLSVPGDVSVAGFDDTAVAAAIWPALTTIRQPIAEMAATAVQLLSDSRGDETRQAARVVTINAITLVERDSVAPPA